MKYVEAQCIRCKQFDVLHDKLCTACILDDEREMMFDE